MQQAQVTHDLCQKNTKKLRTFVQSISTKEHSFFGFTLLTLQISAPCMQLDQVFCHQNYMQDAYLTFELITKLI